MKVVEQAANEMSAQRGSAGSAKRGKSGSPKRGKSGSPKRGTSGSSKRGNSGSATNRIGSSTSKQRTDVRKQSGKSDDDEGGAAGAARACSSTGRRIRVEAEKIKKGRLKSLNLAGQGMTLVPPSVLAEKNVGELNMSCNNLRILPPEFVRLTQLVHLDLSKNGLRCLHPHDYSGLPAALNQLTSLRILLLSECNLPFIPPAVWGCRSLTVLDISRNKINVLVPEVGQLDRLEHLNAQQTSIVTLPAEVVFCQHLEEVLLWGNVIESLPETLKEMPRLQRLAINLRSFCAMVDSYMEGLIRKGQIQSEHLPAVLFQMPQLDVLDITETKINTIPDQCAGRLREFYLANNYFRSMPRVVASLDSLRVLDVSGNMITVVPEEIAGLAQLEVLKLNNNNIDELPACVGELGALTELALANNRLTTLPTDIGRLEQLKTLILSNNELRALPDSIVKLQMLETLDLTSNQLTSLPTTFYHMQSITTAHSYHKFHKHGLWLHLNPLESPPPEIWKTDNPENIYSFLKKLQIRKTENLQRQKIFILGESQCGKTSFIRTLMSGKSTLTRASVDSTKGVDFSAWLTDNNVPFMVHDLSGSAIYRPIQSMLLDPSAIYIIVYDHRKYTPQTHEGAIGYWLDWLQLFAPEAVVKIVGTQCDLCCSDIRDKIAEQAQEGATHSIQSTRDKLAAELTRVTELLTDQRGGHVVALLEQQQATIKRLLATPLRLQPRITLVSAPDETFGFPELINELELLAIDAELFPAAQRHVPDSWVEFKVALKHRRDHYLTMSQVAKMAEKHQIASTTLPEVLQYLHDVGEVLWFHRNVNLQEIIFQRPKAMLDILHSIYRRDTDMFFQFESNRVFTCKGNFNEETYTVARERLEKHGQISRRFLLCLWFEHKLSRDSFRCLLELVSSLDLCYLVPQPALPPKHDVFVPLMTVPYFNKQHAPADLGNLWPPTSDLRQLSLNFTFPISFPQGVFEKMSCRVQVWSDSVPDSSDARQDWADVVCAGGLLLTRSLHPDTYDCLISLCLRGGDLPTLRSKLGQIYSDVRTMFDVYPGLVWRLELTSHNCDDVSPEERFPSEIMATQ